LDDHPLELIAKIRKDSGSSDLNFKKENASNKWPDALNGVDEDETPDLLEVARDQIERHIATNSTGHSFTRLIDAILTVDGYKTRVFPPGPDKSLDIVAGKGVLGFDNPKLVVQVKSGSIVVDQQTLQALLGSIQDVNADHGLLVSWSGFTHPVIKRTNDLYFRVRLWGRDEIVEALLRTYDRLPESIRADLPLQRMWALIPEDEN
jgi:restriction system protein